LLDQAAFLPPLKKRKQIFKPFWEGERPLIKELPTLKAQDPIPSTRPAPLYIEPTGAQPATAWALFGDH